ncbi:hypothetical protein [Kitasatospora terrestris]|uniref:DUF11 domain-containing protein n=1 Tax=Kitasatospora terrestris TaxID=258051 RepID=A0ABP9DQN7_9ACTN
MSTSVINRFAKNVALARSGWSRRGRRLAATVPLAAVLAVGAVACDNPGARKAAAATSTAATAVPTTSAPSSAPSVPASALPSTPAQAPSTPAATGTTAPTGAATTPAPVKAAARTGFSVRINGLAGARAEAGGRTVAFSVTWTNDTDRSYRGIRPVVASRDFAGARCGDPMPMAAGTLERKDTGGWTKLPSLSQGTGMDYATTGNNARFDLAPGAARTIEYRMALAADNGPGTLPVEATAYIGDDFQRLGKATVTDVQVVDPHRPTAALTQKLPGSVTAGGDAVVVETQVVNFTGGPFKAAAPEVSLLDVQTSPFRTRQVLRKEDVRAEVFWKGAWQSVPTVETCSGATGGLKVDTAAFDQALAAGRGERMMFRFSLARTAPADLTALTVAVGAHADGHYAALTTRQLTVGH